MVGHWKDALLLTSRAVTLKAIESEQLVILERVVASLSTARHKLRNLVESKVHFCAQVDSTRISTFFKECGSASGSINLSASNCTLGVK